MCYITGRFSGSLVTNMLFLPSVDTIVESELNIWELFYSRESMNSVGGVPQTCSSHHDSSLGRAYLIQKNVDIVLSFSLVIHHTWLAELGRLNCSQYA